MMSDREMLIISVVGALIVTASVHADMMPVSAPDIGREQSPYVLCGQTDLRYSDFSSPFNYPSIADLDLWPVELLPEPTADTGQTSDLQNMRSFTDGPGSFALCLYALIGLGLCRSAPWIKKISFEFIPEWYHDGGPFQIGHSLAVTPETLYPTTACCFVQPTRLVESLIPQHSQRTIISLWRKSQFTPDVIASRGPPDMS
ncbi:MAG TPA: hypothetical protein DIU00_17810 [Phycisphaerales bacterium]|nr:hypothetical protein [Phycisphaerales bacterium]